MATFTFFGGNHEKAVEACADRFVWVKDYHELLVEDKEAPRGQQSIVLFHYAMRVWNTSHHGSWSLYGHSHGTLSEDLTSRSIDVGVDVHNLFPISYEEVKAIMAKKQWVSPLAGD
jgi:calcineurin-like phosphoesterase family protein